MCVAVLAPSPKKPYRWCIRITIQFYTFVVFYHLIDCWICVYRLITERRIIKRVTGCMEVAIQLDQSSLKQVIF